jgi:hypothetical protein
LDETTILQRSENAAFEVVADEAILIRLDTGTYFSLNKVGTEFWEMLDGEQSISDHAAVIAEKYEVDTAMVTADLLELAGKMAQDDLVLTV